MLLSQIIEKDAKEPPVYILNQTEKLLSAENPIHSAVLAGNVLHHDITRSLTRKVPWSN